MAAATCLALTHGVADAQPPPSPYIVVNQADVRLQDSVYYLQAVLTYQLTPPVIEALENGVPLPLEVQVELERPRWWWWDEGVAELSQFYLLQFHAMSRRYLLTQLNSSAQRSFSSLSRALTALGDRGWIPLLDSSLLDSDAEYLARLRARLDIESLPPPLRPIAYLSPRWRLASEWYEWPVRP